jgi:kynurenine formamidase
MKEPTLIEFLNNLDQVPKNCGIRFAIFPKPKGGSGFQERAFAVIE